MNLDPATISSTILVIVSITAAFLAALWLSLLFWTYRDIRKRTQDRLVVILAVLIVAILFLPGVLIYLIMRPQYSSEEEYQRTLEEEALLQSIEDRSFCMSCGYQIQPDWVICPQCHNKLKKICSGCQKLLDFSWDICPYCETPSSTQEALFDEEDIFNSLSSDNKE